jgi:curved DNA-binding protein CbpA
MPEETLYDVLGVARSASPEEIKAAYRRLSSLRHPDRDGGDPERMSQLNVAYQVLGSPDKRRKYDETGFASGPSMSLEQKANAVMMQVFATCMGSVPDAELPFTDLFKKVREALDNRLKENYKKRSELQTSMASVEKIQKRVKGGDLFEGVFESNLRNARNAIADLDEADQIIGLIHRHIAQYSMDCEPRPNAVRVTATGNFSSRESAPEPDTRQKNPEDEGEWVSAREMLKRYYVGELPPNPDQWEYRMDKDAYRRRPRAPEKPYYRQKEKRW